MVISYLCSMLIACKSYGFVTSVYCFKTIEFALRLNRLTIPFLSCNISRFVISKYAICAREYRKTKYSILYVDNARQYTIMCICSSVRNITYELLFMPTICVHVWCYTLKDKKNWILNSRNLNWLQVHSVYRKYRTDFTQFSIRHVANGTRSPICSFIKHVQPISSQRYTNNTVYFPISSVTEPGTPWCQKKPTETVQIEIFIFQAYGSSFTAPHISTSRHIPTHRGGNRMVCSFRMCGD